MNRSEAAQMMERLMSDFGLTPEWVFEWMSRRNTLGLCKHGTKVLLLSTIFVDHNDEDTVEQVCRHEIAHALAGPGEGHNDYWKSVAIQCGVRDPKSTCSEAVLPPARYQANCPTCDRLYSRTRAANRHRQHYCSTCYPMMSPAANSRERFERCGLVWRDTKAPALADVLQKRFNAPVSAEQDVAGVTTQASTESAPKRESATAPELAAALGVDAKTFRAWLRKHPDLAWEFKEGAGYQFNAQGIRTIVRLWNDTH